MRILELNDGQVRLMANSLELARQSTTFQHSAEVAREQVAAMRIEIRHTYSNLHSIMSHACALSLMTVYNLNVINLADVMGPLFAPENVVQVARDYMHYILNNHEAYSRVLNGDVAMINSNVNHFSALF